MKNRRWTAVIALAVLLVLLPLGARSASAALIQTTGRPLAPAIGYAPQDRTYLLVWAEDRGLGTGLDLYAVRVTRTGIPVGREIQIVGGPGNQSDPALAFSERVGDYLVVYTTDETEGPDQPGPPNPSTPLPTTPPGTPGTPPPQPSPPGPPNPLGLTGASRVGVDGAAVDVVAGDEAVRLPRTARARRVGALAAQVNEIPDLSLGAARPDDDPRTDDDAATEHLTRRDDTWRLLPARRPAEQPTLPPLPTPGPSPTPTTVGPSPTAGATATAGASPTAGPTATAGPGVPPPPPPNAPGARDIWGVWVARNGVPLTNTFPLIAAPSDDTFPSLAYRNDDGQDDYALVWREVTGVDAAIVVQRLSSAFGRYLIYEGAKANVVAGGDVGRPSVAVEETTRAYLVVWAQTPENATARDVFGRRLNANAWPYGAIRVLAEGAADQVYPSIGSLGDRGGFLAVWEQREVGGAEPDIRVRQLNRNGVPLRQSYDVAGGAPFSFAPDVPSSDQPTTLAVWLDRNPASDHSIVGVEVTRGGRRVGPERLIVQGGSGPAAVTPVPPPPGFPTPPPLPPPPPTP